MSTSLLPLDGVRVLDLSRVLAGPFCSMVLADLGADVIKVERPGQGDDTRQWGPPFIDSMSAYFAAVNRNKRSFTLDMAKPAGREVLAKLIQRSDVLLENFLPSAARKFEITPDKLRELNPKLVVCSISGFGRTGPWSDLPGYDFIVQALSGLMSITGEPEGHPMKMGVALTDVLVGLYAAVSILAALWGKGRSAEGGEPAENRGLRIADCGSDLPKDGPASSVSSGSPPSALRPPPWSHIDLSLLDCTLASLVNVAQAYLVTGERPVRYGNAHPHIVPYECFQTSDGYIVLAVGNDEQWRRFCEAVGRADWTRDPRYETNPQRVAHRRNLVAELSALFRTATTAEWTRRLAAIPHAPVLGLDEVLAHPQVVARHMVQETNGGMKLMASPIRMNGQPMPLRSAPPALGQHTEEILHELGYSTEAISELRSSGVV